MKAARWLCIGLIRGYQYLVSPLLPRCCRFAPTCSAYAAEAFERHGALAGFALTAWRLLRCNPWGGHGYDPVPERLDWRFTSRRSLGRLARPRARSSSF
jgi:hypothetical protein